VLEMLAVLPRMRARRDGLIIHIASISVTTIFLPSGTDLYGVEVRRAGSTPP